MSYRRASTDFAMSDLIRVEKTLIDIDYGGWNQSIVSIFSSTCRLVVSVIPPLLRLGLIDYSGCVAVGVAIGMVVAATSNRYSPR